MRVTVDPLRCGCTGYCVRVAPRVFRLDASGPARVIVSSLGTDLADVVREAASVCPTNAIVVLEGGEEKP
jgi:ferredoxin